MTKILVCDDDPSHGEEINEYIRDAGQSASPPLTGEQLKEELGNLFAQIRSFQTDAGDGHRRWDFSTFEPIKSRFDDVDVLLLDNNLTLLANDGPPLTAESIAGYVRAFTDARYIVSLNMNPDVDFDLRYLVGDFLTRADLAINGKHLENGYLWTGKPGTDGFCPWYWPRLASVAEYRKKQIEFVLSNYDNSVLDSLGFDDESVQMLSRHAQGTLSPDASPGIHGSGEKGSLRGVKFADFFLAKSRALPVQDERAQLHAAYSQNEAVRRVVARIVAADIDLWLRRDVIGPQEPLIDVPHLTGRFPFLLGTRAADVVNWNDSVTAGEPPFGWERQIYDDLLSPTRFDREHVWVQNPCFWWSKLNNDDRLNGRLLSSRGDEWADVVFCEDVSRFQHRTGGEDHHPPVEFVAEFEGLWNRRHIAMLEGVQYAPRTRLAL